MDFVVPGLFDKKISCMLYCRCLVLGFHRAGADTFACPLRAPLWPERTRVLPGMEDAGASHAGAGCRMPVKIPLAGP